MAQENAGVHGKNRKDDEEKVKTFSFYLFTFLQENPQYAKDMIDTLCQFFKILAYGVILAIIVFGILAIQHYFT